MCCFEKKSFLTVLILILTTYTQTSFQIVPIKDLIKQHPEIGYQKCFGQVPFHYEKFSILPTYANQGYFLECFIAKIPHGKAQSKFGFIFVDQCFIEELTWGDRPEMLNIPETQPVPDDQVIKLSGRVAVIAQLAYFSYSHWMNEVLGRLAMLEMYGMEYDWLYVPCDKPFMKETLQLWGVDPRKIIVNHYPLTCIEADELIVPSLVINTNLGFKNHIGLYTHPHTLRYVRNKLLTAAKQQNSVPKTFSKKIFISRKDAPWRKMTNEDEVFHVLKQYGFERYELSKMSVADQVLLFHNAEVIIAEHGTGLVNCIFCQPDTKVFEIFHTLIDSSFWYISQTFHLNYTPVKTTDFNPEHMTNWPMYINEYMINWQTNSYMPLSHIHQIMRNLQS